jgi:hypothetical protein
MPQDHSGENDDIIEGQHRARDTLKIRGRAWHPRARGAPTDEPASD